MVKYFFLFLYIFSHTLHAQNVLYFGCKNKVHIPKPKIEEDKYEPIFITSDAIIERIDTNTEDIWVMPLRANVRIKVANKWDFNVVAEVNFRTQDSPIPSFIIKINGKSYKGNEKIAKGDILGVKLIPDPDFLRVAPFDADFGKDSVMFFVQIQQGPPTLVKKIYFSSENISQKAFLMPFPDEIFEKGHDMKVYVEFSRSYRINYKREKTPFRYCGLFDDQLNLITK
jgi:hypothetical protein